MDTYHRLYDTVYDILGSDYDVCRGDIISPPPPADTETFSCTVNNVTTTWNASDYGAVFWWTHGWENGAVDILDLSHAATLDNNHPAFTFQCSCTNSHPETSTNLSYSLLKNGAIATIGATRVSWYFPGWTDFAGSTCNAGMTYEYAKRVIQDGMKCGRALQDMKQSLLPGLWMNFTDFCLYGDPEVAMIESNITDNPPTISDIPDQTTQRDIEITVPFTISDDITPVADLKLSVISSNPALVPNENMIFGGSGEERTLKITPAQGQTGSLNITISVIDALNNSSIKKFLLNIRELNNSEWIIPQPQGSSLYSVWGTSKDNVYAVGDGGTILHYDGEKLTVVNRGTATGIQDRYGASGGLSDIWGTSENNIYAVGSGGTILHYNGVDWEEMNSGVYNNLKAIWGSSPNDIFVVGDRGTFLHYDGYSWEEMISPDSNIYFLHDVYGFSSNDVYAIESCIMAGEEPTLKNRIYHYDGIRWRELPYYEFNSSINSIWGTSPNNIYVIGNSELYHYNGYHWDIISTDIGGSIIWGTSETDIYVNKRGGVYQYDGFNWSHSLNRTYPFIHGIWGSSSSDCFAVGGNGAFFYYNGVNWTELSLNTDLSFEGIWGSSSSDIYAIAENYTDKYDSIYHYNGNTWSEMIRVSEGKGLFDISGIDSQNVFVAGNYGRFYYYNGISWSETEVNTSSHFNSIWVNSSNNIFLGGNYHTYSSDTITPHGIVYHYNGNYWNEILDMPSVRITDIWGSSYSDVFVVGNHYNEGSRETWMILSTSTKVLCQNKKYAIAFI